MTVSRSSVLPEMFKIRFWLTLKGRGVGGGPGILVRFCLETRASEVSLHVRIHDLPPLLLNI